MRSVVFPALLVLIGGLGVYSAAGQDEDKSAGHKSKRGSLGESPAPIHATGIVRHIDNQNILVEADDTRILTCKLTSATVLTGPSGKVTVDDIETGMHVNIQAKRSVDGEELMATSVEVEDNPIVKPAEEKTSTIQKPASDEDRPILRHGIPPKRKKDEVEEAETIVPAKPPDALADDVAVDAVASAKPSTSAGLLVKARAVTDEFTRKLPDFVCQQFTTRYQRETRQSGWVPRDVVSATVVFTDGHEDYQDIKVGNRPVKEEMMGLKGQRSTGEFGLVLQGLMSRNSDADFRYVKDAQMHRLTAKVYDFTVKRENSDWRILETGQSLIPSYSGRVWIDRDSGQVLRIERQADNIPEAFPIDAVEQTLDYDFVTLGGRKVLVPTESENLSCQRGTSFCGKNVIEFRNYREFRGEATINFEK